MSPEFAEKRQRWYDSVQPGALVRYNEWSSGYTNKPALILAIENKRGIAAGGALRLYYTILVDEHKRFVYQDFISPWGGWENIDRE